MSKHVKTTRSKAKAPGKLSLHKKVVTASAMKRKVLSSISSSSSSRELDESGDFSDNRTRSGLAKCRRKIQSVLPVQKSASSGSTASIATSADDITESHDSSDQLDSEEIMLQDSKKLCPSCNRFIFDGFEEHVKVCLREKFQSGRQSPVLLQQQAEDEALARQLQDQEAGIMPVTAVSESEPICCQICQKDLSHLNAQRRLQHVNVCIDMSEKAEKEEKALEKEMSRLKNLGLDCPMCGRHHKTEASREKHMKKCANELKVTREQLLELLKQQKEDHEVKIAALQPSDLKTVQVKSKVSTSSVSRVRGQRKTKKQETDEETQVALALSSSLIEEQQKQERQLLAQLTQMHEAAGLVQGGQKKGKAPARKSKKNKQAPVSLLMQLTAEEAQHRIERRANMLIASQHYEQILPSTPVFIGSVLNKALTEGMTCKPSYQRDLWHLAGHSSTNSSTKEIRLAYYVSKLMPPVSMSCVEAGSKIKRMSIIPGRNVSMVTNLEQTVIQEAVLEEEALSQDEREVETGPVQTQTLTVLAELAAEADEPDQLSGLSTLSDNTDIASHGDSDSIQASGFCPEERLVLTRDGEQIQSAILKELPWCLCALVNDDQYSDIRLITKGGGSVSGHRVIISASCPALLQSVGEDGCIDLSEFSHGAIICLLKFIYSREFILTRSILGEVTLLAERYNLPTLISLCQRVETATSATSLPDCYEEETTDLDNITSSLDTLMKTVWNEEGHEDVDAQHVNTSSNDDKHDEELDEAIEFLVSQQAVDEIISNSNATKGLAKPLSNVVSGEFVNSSGEEDDDTTEMSIGERRKDDNEFHKDNEDVIMKLIESNQPESVSADIPVGGNIRKATSRLDYDDLCEEMDIPDSNKKEQDDTGYHDEDNSDVTAFKIEHTKSDNDDSVNEGPEVLMDIDENSSDSSEDAECKLDLAQQQYASRLRESDTHESEGNHSYSPMEKNNMDDNTSSTGIDEFILRAGMMNEEAYSFIATSPAMSKELRQIYERSMYLMDRMESKSMNRSTSELFSDDDDDEDDKNNDNDRLVNLNPLEGDGHLAKLDSKCLVVNKGDDYEPVASTLTDTDIVAVVISDSNDTSVSCSERQTRNKVNDGLDKCTSHKALSIDNIDIIDSRVNNNNSLDGGSPDRGVSETSRESKETSSNSWLIPATPDDKAPLCVTEDTVFTKSYKICLPRVSNRSTASGSRLDNPGYKLDAASCIKDQTDMNTSNYVGQCSNSSKSPVSNTGRRDVSILNIGNSTDPYHAIPREYQNRTCLFNRSGLYSDMSFSNVNATQSGPQMSTPMMETHRSRTHIKHKRQSIQLSPVHLNHDRDSVKVQYSFSCVNTENEDRAVHPASDTGSKKLHMISDPRLVLSSRPSRDIETSGRDDQIQSGNSALEGKTRSHEYSSSPKFPGKSSKPSKKDLSLTDYADELSDTDSEEIVLLMETSPNTGAENVINTSVITNTLHETNFNPNPSENPFLQVNNSPKLTSNLTRHSNVIADTNVINSPKLASSLKRHSNMLSDTSSQSSGSDNELSNLHFSKRQKFDFEMSELPGKLRSHVPEKIREKSSALPSTAIDLTGDSDNEDELDQNEPQITNPHKVFTELDGQHENDGAEHHREDLTYNDAGVWDDFDDGGFGMNVLTSACEIPNNERSTLAAGQELMTANTRRETNEDVHLAGSEHHIPSPTIVADEHESSHHDLSLQSLPSAHVSPDDVRSTNITNSPCVRLYADDIEISDLDGSFVDCGKAVSVIQCAKTAKVHDISMSDAEDQPPVQFPIPDVVATHVTPAPAVKKPRKNTQWQPPSPFTPMLEYDKMATPILKEAVQKVGVRPVGKKRMIRFLKDVYQQTHQYETDSEFEGSFSAVLPKPIIGAPSISSASHLPKKPDSSSNVSKKLTSAAQGASRPTFEKPAGSISPAKKSVSVKSTKSNSSSNASKKSGSTALVAEKTSNFENPIDLVCPARQPKTVKSRKKASTDKTCVVSGVTTVAGVGSVPTQHRDQGSSSTSQESTDESYDEMLEESVLAVEDMNDQEYEPDLNIKLMRMFKTDPDLYNRILLYEPLEFDWLKGRVKEAGIKCAAPKLLNFLDERCITFTMRSQRGAVKRKGRGKKAKKTS